MIDKTRERFESQKFPENVTPFYLGRMHNKSSLGRYLLGISPSKLPMKIQSIKAVSKTYSDIGASKAVIDGDMPCLTEIYTTFDIPEPVAAYHMNYVFYDVWGNISGEGGYTIVIDTEGMSNTLMDKIVYDIDADIEIKDSSKVIGLTPNNFHICLFGLSSIRTTDGGLYRMEEDCFSNILNWALPLR